MPRRHAPTLLLALLAALAAAGCQDALTALSQVEPGAPPGAATVGGPGTGPVGVAGGAPAAGPGGRSERDRPDDSPELQAHAVYFLPADAPDEKLDTSGAIARTLAAGQAWMRRETGGAALRFDAYQGQPDVTFYRSKRTTADLGTSTGAILDAVAEELEAAGLTDPMKLYSVFYGGRLPALTDPTVRGKAGTLYSVMLYRQCSPCSGPDAYERTLADGYDLTALHEAFHLLGVVPECAPHRAADSAHTTDDPDDIMAAKGVSKVLDRGRDDYFGHGRAGCFDLAKSPFLDPLPADAALPAGFPVARSAGAGAVEAKLARLTDTPGEAALEAEFTQAINAARAARGLAPLRDEPRLRAAARRWTSDPGDLTFAEAARDAGLGKAGGVGSRGFGDAASARAGLMGIEAVARAVAADPTDVTALGVGVVATSRGLKVAVATGYHPLELQRVQVAAGPFGSRTVAFTVRAVGAAARWVTVKVGEGHYDARIRVGEAPATVIASVPRAGATKVSLLVSAAEKGKLDYATSWEVRGDGPAEAALTGDP